jgi:hypothetical protein
VGNGTAELLEAPLSIQNFRVEQILVVAIERFAFQIFVSCISLGDGGARQDIFETSVNARLLKFRCTYRFSNRSQNGAYAYAIGFSV